MGQHMAACKTADLLQTWKNKLTKGFLGQEVQAPVENLCIDRRRILYCPFLWFFHTFKSDYI